VWASAEETALYVCGSPEADVGNLRTLARK